MEQREVVNVSGNSKGAQMRSRGKGEPCSIKGIPGNYDLRGRPETKVKDR